MTTPTLTAEDAEDLQRLASPAGYVGPTFLFDLTARLRRHELLTAAQCRDFERGLAVLRTVWNLYKEFRPVNDPGDPYWTSDNYQTKFSRVRNSPLAAKALTMDRGHLEDLMGPYHQDDLSPSGQEVLDGLAHLVGLHRFELHYAQKYSVEYSSAFEGASRTYACIMDALLLPVEPASVLVKTA